MGQSCSGKVRHRAGRNVSILERLPLVQCLAPGDSVAGAPCGHLFIPMRTICEKSPGIGVQTISVKEERPVFGHNVTLLIQTSGN